MNSWTEEKKLFRFICAVILCFAAAVPFFSVWYFFIRDNNQTGALTGYGNLGMAVLIYLFLFCFLSSRFHGFSIGVHRRIDTVSSNIIALFLTDAVEVLVSMAITGQFRFFGAFAWRYALLFIGQSVLISLLLIPMISLYRQLFPPLHMLEIHGEYTNDVCEKVNGVKFKYCIDKSIHFSDPHLNQTIAEFDAVLINDVPDEVRNDILKYCFDYDVRVYFVPKISDIIVKASDDLNLFDTPFYLCRNNGISSVQRAIKRGFDLIMSLLAIMILSPVFLAVAIAIKIDDGGPVFYRQERVTINLKRFMILKFRSMIVDAEKDGRSHPAGSRDDRITRVGCFIRATRIDELPQLFNILKGDMSIVGPRPERVEHVQKYTADIPEFSFRYKVKGGLTGYAQVYGKYNTTALDKLKLDLEYIMNYSLRLDVQIILETIKVLFQKESTEGFTEERAAEMHDAETADERTRVHK